MTNVAISGLPAATALDGTELVPVVQASSTRKSTALGIRKYVLDEYIDARDYAIYPDGSQDSSVGGNQAISDAITHKKRLVWPSGYFRLDAPLLASIGPYDGLHMEGQGTGDPDPKNPGSPPVANTFFVATFTNAPAIVLNEARTVVLRDFAILGQNTAPETGSGLPTGPSISQADYITAGCQTGRYAPYCGIAFDPFCNSTSNNITGLTQATQAVVTVSTVSGTNPFAIGQMIVFSGVAGMTQINGLIGTVTAIGVSSGHWTATLNINSSTFNAYTSGGGAVGLPCTVATIAGIVSQGSSTLVTFPPSGGFAPFQYAQSITFSGVSGMTQINGLSGAITAITRNSSGAWQVLVNINSASFAIYISGGQAVASDAYTTLATWYQAGYAATGSYACLVENVAVHNFVVGIAIGSSGNQVLAADMTFRNVNVDRCDVCYAIGQSQSRNLNIEYGNITAARTGFDGCGYGIGNGTPPQLLRQNFGLLYRLFAFNSWVGNLVVEDGYGESNVCFGQFGQGQIPSNAALTFIGGDYSFSNPTWTEAPILLETYTPTTFLGTGIIVNSMTAPNRPPILNILHQDIPVTFERCVFGGTSTGHAPHVGLGRDGQAVSRFVDCWVGNTPQGFVISNDLGRSWGAARFTTPYGSGRLEATYQTYRVSDGLDELIYIPYSKYTQIWVSGVNSASAAISGTTLTFTCSTAAAAQLAVNDILFWSIRPQGYSNQAGYWVPAVQITGFSTVDTTVTVTCRLLFDPSQYWPTDQFSLPNFVGVAPNHWAPTQALTCTTTNGSLTLTGVSPITILQNGDFVAGTGIPANTRVTGGGGTATVTISQAATASASGTNLYFGRLNKITLTPAS